MKTFNFTLTFTRPDEQDANVYTVGYNAYGTRVETVADAEAQVRRHNAHLTLKSVVLTAVMDEDGNIIEADRRCHTCGDIVGNVAAHVTCGVEEAVR